MVGEITERMLHYLVASAALHRATLLTNDTQLLKLAADEPGYPAVPF